MELDDTNKARGPNPHPPLGHLYIYPILFEHSHTTGGGASACRGPSKGPLGGAMSTCCRWCSASEPLGAVRSSGAEDVCAPNPGKSLIGNFEIFLHSCILSFGSA